MTWEETVEHGIENAPTAFLKLFKGENLGKMLVKLDLKVLNYFRPISRTVIFPFAEFLPCRKLIS